jgi:hypothetical protein
VATSYFLRIANAVKAALSDLGGGLSIVVREEDSVKTRDTYPLAVVTMGDEGLDQLLDVTGGAGTDQGDIGVTYQIGVSIYRENLGDIAADDTNPAYVQRAQQILGRARPLADVPTVYMGTLVRNAAWEGREFVKGVEVSRFAVIFHNAEPRCG